MGYPESDTQIDYKIRVDKVFKYIDAHLDGEISLGGVSEAASFSPYHFHRVFKAVTGETLGGYVTRRRMEKAAADLLHKPLLLTEIFQKYGFSDHASFTRTFRKFYKMSPTEFRKQNQHRFSKISQVLSKIGQAYPEMDKYLRVIDGLKNWINMNAKIEIKKTKKQHLACVSCIGHQNLAGAYQKIIRWATPLGLLAEHSKMVTVYHDSFKVTDALKVRMDACILLDGSVNVSNEITSAILPGGKHIVGSFEIGLDDFEQSWTGLFLWMNEHGYKKADGNPFEVYHNDFTRHPEKKAIVDFYIPVE